MNMMASGFSPITLPNGVACSGMDMLGLGFAVLGPRRTVLLSNETWGAILSDANRGLIWASGSLNARRGADMQALGAALDAALTGERSLLRIEDVAGGGALEMLAEGIGPQDSGQPRAAVIIRQPETVWPDAESLASLYCLTPAEAGLAESLVRGMGLAAACRERGISQNTGKGYLKRIFEKTGARRQSELVAMVMQGVSPFAVRHDAFQARESA
ncbi:helix-turn-helix transcriptional regulator [Alkalicaulis satelles]|uniref:Helix-turn-helix transcriptional regulator n=1 Tax=Alkalicaulis satelles TaxID=2609175 RepID=A0A5M6ZKS0_9PROT|nr:helix-turn-helix transcriptional regulator [Alkalicaulis satelles]KAA5805419.1 helix-turn-helix transcriptional regulator [Alkalicaulis satelles]